MKKTFIILSLLLSIKSLVWAASSYSSITSPLASTDIDYTAFIRVIDYDADGDEDLLGYDGSQLVFYQNNGSGSFTKAVPNIAFFLSNAKDYHTFDYDNDGDKDLIREQGNTFYRNDGGTFTSITSPLASTDIDYIAFIRVIDYDADGDEDLLAYDGSQLVFYQNNGSGSFTKAIPNITFNFDNANRYYTFDYDNDGDQDLIHYQGNAFYKSGGDDSGTDNSPPQLTTFTPADNATGVDPASNFILNFDETIASVGTGTFKIFKSSDNSLVESIAGNDAKVTGVGTSTITINPATILTDMTEYYIQINKGAFFDTDGMTYNSLNEVDTTSMSFTTGSSKDTDSNLLAGDGVDESSAITIPSTATASVNAVELFDFAIFDSGSSDGLATIINSLDIHVSGTDSAKLSYLIANASAGSNQGTDLSTSIAGTYNSGTVSFDLSSNNISVADGTTETYVIKAYIGNPTSLTDNSNINISIDGDTDLGVDGSGSAMGSTSVISNSNNTKIDITATKLIFSTAPAGSTSGSTLSTQPVVKAVDANSNTDSDYTTNISISKTGSGTLSGTTSISPVSGTATFTDLTYSATADNEDFTLTSSSGSLTSATSATITSDVAATKLRFTTQPSPLNIGAGISVNFTQVPVVEAVDASDILDEDYTSAITLSEINGAGVASLNATGDTDGGTVTLSATNGELSFSALSIVYTLGGVTSENFNLQASATGLSSATSDQLTASDLTAPSGYSVNMTTDPVNTSNVTAAAFVFSGAEVGTTYNYSIDDTDGATSAVTGSGTIATATDAITGIDLSSLEDGTLTLNVTLTDSANNTGSTASDSVLKDVTAPVLAEVTPVVTPASDTTPNYTFSTDTTGTLTMGGSCGTSSSTTIGSTGNITITLTDTDNTTPLTDANYSDCNLTLTDDQNNSTTLSISAFTIDITAPTLISVMPQDDNTTTPTDTNLTLTFDEAIQFGTGNIVLRYDINDSVAESFDVNSSGTNLSINDTVLTIVPTQNLLTSTSYYIIVENGAIRDTMSTPNDYVPNMLKGDWSFTTIDDTPDPISFSSLTNQSRSVQVVSQSATITGIDNGVKISIDNGEYEINKDGNWTTIANTIDNDDNVTVRLTTSSSYNTITTATLTVGTTDITFSARTQNAPVSPPTPDPDPDPTPDPDPDPTPDPDPDPTPDPDPDPTPDPDPDPTPDPDPIHILGNIEASSEIAGMQTYIDPITGDIISTLTLFNANNEEIVIKVIAKANSFIKMLHSILLNGVETLVESTLDNASTLIKEDKSVATKIVFPSNGTELIVTAFADGTSKYKVIRTDGISSEVFVEIIGALTSVNSEGVVTALNRDDDTCSITVDVTTDTQGESISRFIRLCGEERKEVYSTSTATPFESGNIIFIREEDGKLIIEIETSLTRELIF